MKEYVVRVQGRGVLLLSSCLIVCVWSSIAVMLSVAFVDYGGWDVFDYASGVMFASAIAALLMGGRAICGNCGEKVLADTSFTQDHPVASVKPWARVAMQALFVGKFACPHCGVINTVR